MYKLKKMNSGVTSMELLLIRWYFFLSSFVIIEPALCDILFLAFIPFLILKIKFNRLLLLLSFIGLGFISTNIFTIIFFENSGAAIFTSIIRIYLILFLIVFSFYISKLSCEDLSSITKYFFAGIIINCIAILFTFLFDPAFMSFVYRDEFHSRFKGFFQDPNVLGPQLVLGFFLVTTLVKKSPSVLLGLLFVLIGAALTYSRATWGGFILVGTFIFCFCLYAGVIKVNLKYVVIILVLFTLLLGFSGSFLKGDRISHLIDNFSNRATLQDYDNDRFEGQRVALDLFIENPIGHGPGSTVRRYGGVMPGNDPHNTYLKIAVENGFMGIILWCLLVLFTLYRGLRLINRNYFLGASLFSIYSYFILNSLMIDTVHWRSFYILSALIIGLSINKNLLLNFNNTNDDKS